MATKEKQKVKLKVRAARAREDFCETGRVVLRAPALVRGAECTIRFMLGSMLAGAEIFGGYAPFGLSMVAASGSGLDGFCALLGACFGYLSFQGFAEGLRYVAASILVFSISFAFYDVRFYRKAWFMPAAAALMDGLTGVVYLSDRGWTPENVIFFGTEVLLCGAGVYFYRIAFSPWTEKREEGGLTLRQTVSLLILMGTLLITLSKITLLGEISLGRCAAAVAVMVVAYKGGIGAGSTIGVATGLGMDLAAGGLPFYSMSYAFSGVMTGIFHRQGRLFSALAYVLANAVAVLWTWSTNLHLSSLYEIFIASVCFLVIPEKALRRVGGLLKNEPRMEAEQKARVYVRRKMEDTAAAFRGLYENMRASLVSRGRPNNNDTATIFDRTATRVCKSCVMQSTCWQREYVSTFNALNDTLPAMLERGRGEAADYPVYFSSRCMKFPLFVATANEELAALLYRRQFQSQLRENRAAVCRQYAELAGLLGTAAAELGAELAPDPAREKRIRQHLTALGVEAKVVVYYDEDGHLRVELEGPDLDEVKRPEVLAKLSKLVGIPLRLAEEDTAGGRDRAVLVQCEPLMAVAGIAARNKDGETVSGDTGAWFKNDDGSLYVLLCDGMGSGPDANRESSAAVQLLERFLRAGVPPETALKTLNSALALRGEEVVGFTTIDLLRVDLFTGEAGVYKYGAAPTYVKKKGSVARVTGSALPAGLADGDNTAPDVTRLKLEAGDSVLLVSDGVAGGEGDVWIREMLGAYQGGSPKELVCAIIGESESRAGSADDRTVLLLKLDKR